MNYDEVGNWDGEWWVEVGGGIDGLEVGVVRRGGLWLWRDVECLGETSVRHTISRLVLIKAGFISQALQR